MAFLKWKKIKKAIFSLAGERKRSCSAVILAGGQSTRMGGISKQLFSLRDKPIAVYSMLAFEACPSISEIILVAAENEIAAYRGFKEKYGITKLAAIVKGGLTRAQSAANGFAEVSDKSGFVAIHDAARCLITPEEIERVVEAGRKYGAAIAAAQATDTVKVADEQGFIRETPDRSTLWLAQTPQVFKKTLYEVALAKVKKLTASITDDASIVEAAGFKVKLVPCSHDNLKITRRIDLATASKILAARNGGTHS